jgi:hypothetical protein
MPFVPQLPGVPALTSYAASTITLLVSDAISFLFGLGDSQWGVFLDGAQAFDYDSFNSIGYRGDSVVADYQVEGDGGSTGFMSYDKVDMPFELRVRLTCGGSEVRRQALINDVQEAKSGLDLFDVVTPEVFYEDATITRVSYERTAENGVGMLKMDLTFQQIRTSEATAFSNTQQPGSAGQQGLGNVQPQQGASIGGPGDVTSFPLASVT